MKGLILKDLYMIKAYFRTYLRLIFGFIVLSSFSKESAFMYFYPMILAGSMPFSFFAYDDRSRWNQYCDTLPVSRKTVVSSRYIITLLFVGAVFLLTAAFQLFSPYFSLQTYTANLSVLIVMGLLTPTVLMPLTFRVGVEKGRLFYYLIIGSFCAISVMTASSPITIQTSLPLVLLPIVSILLFILSWPLSVRIYEQKEL